MKKLEVGQYWHNLKNNKELLVSAEIAESVVCRYACEVTKYETMQTEVGEKYYLKYDDVINLGYVLGRHPDNIEQWQPKEGDLVWNSRLKMPCRVFVGCYSNSLRWAGCELKTGDWHSSSDFEDCEPYADQDKKIDFIVEGQWVKFGDHIIKVTVNEDSNSFWGEHL